MRSSVSTNDVMRPVFSILFALLLAACLEPPRSEAHDLCGDPPTISGIATFLTEIQGQPYVCTTADSDHQRSLAVSLTRQWEQCMTEAEAARSLADVLVTARHKRSTASEAVDTWMTAAGARDALVHAEQAPGWEVSGREPWGSERLLVWLDQALERRDRR